MDATEFSDLDGDALTITTNPDGVWITCTHGPHEVTVGPLPMHDLLGALGRVLLVDKREGMTAAPALTSVPHPAGTDR